MKILTFEELGKMDEKKLLEELEAAKKSLHKEAFEVRGGQSKSSHLIRNYRKYIAQIKTLLNQKSNAK